jgi:hypothetical protein
MLSALIELRDSRAAAVNDREGIYTILCRRLSRKLEASQIAREKGSKGGSQTASKREAVPEYENENEGLEKVRGFSRGEGIPLDDADWFFWKCHANGWTNGGKPILDWKATIRSWWKGRFFPSQKQQRNLKGFDPPKRRDAPNTVGGNSKRPSREPTEAEIARSKAIANEHVERLRKQFKMPES